jgi:hypothetical protein
MSKVKTGPMAAGQVAHLGSSLVILEGSFSLAEENLGTTYTAEERPGQRWEAVYEHSLRFIALDEGLAELGGIRVLTINGDEANITGSVGREFESLGDVWVEG